MSGELNLVYNLELNINQMCGRIFSQDTDIQILRIKSAKLKAFLYNRTDLARRLSDQENENFQAMVGKSGTFRTLEEMKSANMLTHEEYKWCDAV